MSTFEPNIPPPPTTFDQWRKATHPFHWWTTNGFDPLPEQTCACGCGRRWDAHIGGDTDG